MKKTLYISFFLMALMALSLYNCSKDDSSTKVAKVTGTVTISDTQAKAGGAIVVISSSPNAASVLTKTIADSSGKFTFVGLEPGTYYLSAKYNSENTNLKSTGMVFVTSTEATVAVDGTDMVKDLALASTAASSGTDVVEYSKALTSSSAATLYAGKYYLDQTHSFVGFTFPFDSANGEFGGHFATFGLDTFKFDQAVPANSKISAWVDVTTSETGSPSLIDPVTGLKSSGRDGLNGCITHTFNVVTKALIDLTASDTVTYKHTAGTATARFLLPSAILSNGKAYFSSTSIAAYGDGYLAKGNLTFMGVTKPISIYFHYIKGYATTANSVTSTYSSLQGFFMMNAKADFGVISGHVKSNPVKVSLSLEFMNKK
jgi:polyisoprenoid-binding protein YceI